MSFSSASCGCRGENKAVKRFQADGIKHTSAAIKAFYPGVALAPKPRLANFLGNHSLYTVAGSLQ